MPKYRKKPAMIEAVQYLGKQNYREICEFVGKELTMEYMDTEQILTIETLEGELKANKGDYIIKGVQGEFYPCKPDIFEKTYEPAE